MTPYQQWAAASEADPHKNRAGTTIMAAKSYRLDDGRRVWEVLVEPGVYRPGDRLSSVDSWADALIRVQWNSVSGERRVQKFRDRGLVIEIVEQEDPTFEVLIVEDVPPPPVPAWEQGDFGEVRDLSPEVQAMDPDARRRHFIRVAERRLSLVYEGNLVFRTFNPVAYDGFWFFVLSYDAAAALGERMEKNLAWNYREFGRLLPESEGENRGWGRWAQGAGAGLREPGWPRR